jgi:hypothetical protein
MFQLLPRAFVPHIGLFLGKGMAKIAILVIYVSIALRDVLSSISSVNITFFSTGNGTT